MRHESEPVWRGWSPELERGAAPLHEQLELDLRERIRGGRLGPGTRLPSSRSLARELGVSRGVVLEAYGQLVSEGYLVASQGAPTRVADAPTAELAPLAAESPAPRYGYNFDPGLPDLAAFPRGGWMRSLRQALRGAAFETLGAGDPRGAPELRNELMRYLGRARGAAPEPEHTLVCAGFTQAYALLCESLRGRGIERIALEDPGWAPHRLIAERAGLEPFPIPVDASGLNVAELTASECETVVVTPAHQFPTGIVMSSERRAALLSWAEEVDGLIVEDDYDSELRYDRAPVGALQGLAPERVCHIGSMSKRLAPGVRIGWVLSPSWLTGELTYAKGLTDGGSPVIDQLALADFVARGELDRHLRRMRLSYRRRRDVAASALARRAPELWMSGAAAGLHGLVYLPRGVRETNVLRAAAQAGVAVEGVGACRIQSAGPEAIVLGYANLTEPAIERGIKELVGAIRAS
jgi:GntR family transcriptional regulator/MocR family aminotransferase